MARSVPPSRQHIVSGGKCALDRLDPIAAAESGYEGVREDGIVEIKCDRIVDDAGEPGERHRPALDTAGLVEPGMDDLELASEPLRWHRDPHPNRKPPLGLMPRPYRRSCHNTLRSLF